MIYQKDIKMIKFAIIILHFGDPKITNKCLESLAKINKNKLKVDIYVLDNQGTINRHSNSNNISILPFIKNYGFAAGNNFVINKIKNNNYDYYLFLNNDTVVYSDLLIQLTKVIESGEKIGICGPVIEHQVKNKTLYDYGGLINWQKTQPKHINKEMYESSINYLERDFVSGCCMLIKTQLFHQSNGFNEKYFMYLEDVDLCVRVAKLDYKIVNVPKARIFHLGSKSASENFKIKQSLINSLRFIIAHTPAKYKLSSFIFNMFFYPSLWLRWKLKKAFSVLKTS